MKVVKYLFALWAAVLLYTFLSFTFGSRGVFAYEQLQSEQAKQEANIENLKMMNRELESTMNSLLYDKDALAVYAREQGYASSQERFIRIVGLGGNQKNRNSAGEIVFAVQPQHVSDLTLKIIAFCTGITIFILFAFFDVIKLMKQSRY